MWLAIIGMCLMLFGCVASVLLKMLKLYNIAQKCDTIAGLGVILGVIGMGIAYIS